MPAIQHVAPQFLVDDLEASLAFYEKRLGFHRDFVYEGFYASVSRDGARLHLKCAPKLDAERSHRRAMQHLDAYLEVDDAAAFRDELASRGIPFHAPLERRPWGAIDFQVMDPDGYLLCFSQLA